MQAAQRSGNVVGRHKVRRELQVSLTHLLQTRAQVAAEDKADPVYLHAMEAGLSIAFLHSLQVGFLFMGKFTPLSEVNNLFIQVDLQSTAQICCKNTFYCFTINHLLSTSDMTLLLVWKR